MKELRMADCQLNRTQRDCRSLQCVIERVAKLKINVTESELCYTSPVSSLKGKLKKQSTATGSGVAKAFLRAQAALFGSYRDALRYRPGEPITFCEESFVAHRSSTMRSFLEMAVNLQLFKQFIDGRLAKLNAGRGFTDIFEEEITEGGFCGSNSRSYQQWMQTVKKGGALINTAVTKASPAVRTAYRFAKSQAKQGIKEMKIRLKQKEVEDEDGPVCDGSPTSTKSLSPKRLQKMRKHRCTKYPVSMGCPDFAIDDDETDTASKVSSEDSGDIPSYTEDSDDSSELHLDSHSSGQMNLLEEILDTLSNTSIDRGSLSGAKSLDFFRSTDDIDYKSTNKCSPPSDSNLDQLDSAGINRDSWHLGQDDSSVHGKQLPPSPRRYGSTGAPGSNRELLQTSSTTASDQQRANCGIMRRKVLSKRTPRRSQDHEQQGESEQPAVRQPSVLVPWEMGSAQAGDGGLLQEIDTACPLTSPLSAGQAPPASSESAQAT